ncbi:MAG TPA: nuclear transport factor 2 family protein [Thermomicrobiales bacterium]|nr:nuclear transport factor 2 family protein [Thermomicrobiales bacterium]
MSQHASAAGPMAVIDRLHRALNAHDLDVFVGCFAPDYQSTFPAHPDRAFSGYEQVRANWSQMFSAVTDLKAELLRAIVDGETVWTEWDWSGTLPEGAPYHMRGVTVMGIRDDRVAWARLYMEPVETGGAGIDAAVRQLTGRERA